MAILSVPYFQQQTEDTCAPACLRMGLALRFPAQSLAEAEVAQRCGCLQGLGCLVDDVYHAAQHYGLAVEWLDNIRIEVEVEAALRADCLVLANVQLRVLPYYQPSHYSPTAW